MKKNLNLDDLHKLIAEFVSVAINENDEDEGGRPRKNPDSAISKLIDNSVGGAEEIADEFDVSVSQVNKWARGESNPSLKKAVKIEKETGGKVPVEYWLKAR